jgi:hypothetical protein
MSKNTLESDLFQTVKVLLSVIAIGLLYYGGGYGVGLFITKDPARRRIYGNLNVKLLAVDIFILLCALCNDIFSPPLNDFFPILFKLMQIQAILTIIGCVAYILWSAWTWLFPSRRANNSSFDYAYENDDDLELRNHVNRSLNFQTEIQYKLNEATDQYVEDMSEHIRKIEDQKAVVRKKLIADLTHVIDLYADDMNLSLAFRKKCSNMDKLSPENLTRLSEEIQVKFGMLIENNRKTLENNK